MHPSLKPLDQQVIVITGASSGIGLATALAAGKQGARLVLVARSKDVLDIVVEHVMAELGVQALAVEADVGQREDVERVAAVALAHFGRIDTWVNNAGVTVYGRLHEVDDAAHHRLFQTNFWGTVNGSLVALPHLRANGGALINVGSEASEAIIPLQGMYTATKHAVKGFTDALRVELAVDEAPVSVTLIQPTAVDTPLPENAANYTALEPKLPTPMIEPEEVAQAILHAATTPQRDVKVGTVAVLDTMMNKLFPSLADAVTKKQIGRQQRAEPAHTRDGSLYKATHRGRIRGRGNDNPANRHDAERANMRPA
ncbi:MAG: SDR family oxidoreductase [Pseudomonadota bacterium]